MAYQDLPDYKRGIDLNNYMEYTMFSNYTAEDNLSPTNSYILKQGNEDTLRSIEKDNNQYRLL